MGIDLVWFDKQVDEFKKVERPRYETYAGTLKAILEHATRTFAPLAIVQVRAKTVPSFAEKVLRKRDKYNDPVRQLTDLCGGRVIVHTKGEVEAICAFIRKHFEIDEANSLDSADRLRASEFGYRSVHYIVSISPEKAAAVAFPVSTPKEVLGLKGEIQVRTIAQHCWADIGHDRVYKSAFEVPDKWVRESARAAALLEDVDETFARVVQGLETYRASYGAYMTEQELKDEIAILETVQKHGGSDDQLALACRIARMAITLQDWNKVVVISKKNKNLNSIPLLCGLGFALCQIHKENPRSAGYLKGQGHLERAVKAAPDDVEVLTTLADTWIGIDNDKALELFARAFEIDPSHPQTLGGYTKLKVTHERTLAFVPLIRPSLEAAIRRCHEQAEVGVNLPWAYYSIGEFNLLLRRTYESLAAYAKATQLSDTEFMIDTALDVVARFKGLKLPEVEFVRRLLLLAKAVRFPSESLRAALSVMRKAKTADIPRPVVIVAGGCDASAERRIAEYRDLLMDAFRDFRGTIISGGTTAGISGLVGDLAERYSGQIRAVGYLPKLIPDWATKDGRYKHFITEGTDFSPLEPLQNWIDLVAAGIAPSQVKLLGINGGEISAFEYRLALALGAKVGLLRDSGREAGRMLKDAEWESMKGLAFLPADLLTVKSFLDQPFSSAFPSDVRERMAHAFHDRYRVEQRGRLAKVDPALADWPDSPEYLKESNRQLVDHIHEKLKAIGMTACPVVDREKIKLMDFSDAEVEIMAEMEHGRWNVERLQDGWTQGPRDVSKKRSPFLISWAELPDHVKDYDRQAVRRIPEILKQFDLEVGRIPDPATGTRGGRIRATRRNRCLIPRGR
jgi:ppGpp synthetase/RelA/SpoT-type nucleotidyltranferase